MKPAIINLVLYVICMIAAVPGDKKTCNFFLIKENNGEVFIEKVILNKNEKRVFKDKSILSYIMVFNPGSKSGELIQKDNRVQAFEVHYDDDGISVNILNGDGTRKKMPVIDPQRAANMIIRLNITGADGYKKAYRIENFETIIEDHGPVLDIFSGKIPLLLGDYSFLTESHESNTVSIIEGNARYDLIRDWITIKCLLPGGKEGCFVVDFGAASTVVSREALPENIDIRNFQMVEYSSEGKKVSNAVVSGATGTVDNIAGITTLPQFGFGDIIIDNFDITVLNNFPDPFLEQGITGIIGRDILAKTNTVTITNLDDPSGKHELIFSADPVTDGDHSIPFTFGGGHLFVKGNINQTPVSFLLDTGAGKSFISTDFINTHKIPYKTIESEKKTAMGLDGKGVEYELVKISNIRIGDIELDQLEFLLSEMYIFESMGLENDAALLGMEFLNQYPKVTFDLINNQLLLWK